MSQSGAETVLGTYCNTFKPPEVMYSSWNRMVVVFDSDGQDATSGFQARYQQMFDDVSADLVWETNSTGM